MLKITPKRITLTAVAAVLLAIAIVSVILLGVIFNRHFLLI